MQGNSAHAIEKTLKFIKKHQTIHCKTELAKQTKEICMQIKTYPKQPKKKRKKSVKCCLTIEAER